MSIKIKLKNCSVCLKTFKAGERILLKKIVALMVN
jgi:hypothetical protein